jgi:mannose-6-phosphate isomerase
MQFGILKFQEVYMERIWGGTKLQQVLGRIIPTGAPVGEAWLIADHPSCESVVAEGAFQGKTLRDLMETNEADILGTVAKPTPGGRFPLLLKLIDAGDVLSVQVHPDDAQAAALNEPDAGKTEMWHVLDADPESTLLSGLCEGVTRESFEAALAKGETAALLHSFPVARGDSVFVAAGDVHAIGAGILLAEIQQNSDITYRLFDWNRVDSNGNPRELHTEKALAVMNFNSGPGERVKPKTYTENGVPHELLAACPYFAAERLLLNEPAEFDTAGKSFHIVQALENAVTVGSENSNCNLSPGEAALIPACTGNWCIEGGSPVLHYYVPDIQDGITGL